MGILKPKEISIYNISNSIKFMMESIEQNEMNIKKANIERSFMYLYMQLW